MTRPLRIEYPGAYYHVTSRGNERKDIFRSNRDREKFLYYLETASKRYKAAIHAYCLMSNHYHLLLETPLGNLSQIMRHVNGAYTTYFNKKRERVGHLFQGRYKAILIDLDEYAKELSRYIHLNPVRAGIVNRPEEYGWSSYGAYVGEKKGPEWLVVGLILSCFGQNIASARRTYRDFVTSLIGKDYGSPLMKTLASTILGSDNFVKKIKEQYLNNTKGDRNLPAIRDLSDRPSIEDISKKVEKAFGEDPVLSKKAALYLCHRVGGMKLREIGSYFGLGESAVSQASSRFAKQMEKDFQLRKKIAQLNNARSL